MKLWIDTEFNSYKGDLISLALVDENNVAFYGAVECPDPHPWVAANVLPVLHVQPEPMHELQARLERYLDRYDSIHIVADWPEDIQHFCAALITGPGERLDTPPLTMEVRRDLDSVSEIPHCAVFDAAAIKKRHLEIEGVTDRVSYLSDGYPEGDL